MIVVDFIKNMLEKDYALDPKELKRLTEHRYSAQDVSWLDELCMKRFWDWLVTFYPLWLAPNLITLIGFICNVVAVAILAYYSPTGKEEAPRWAYLLCAVSLFIYQALDATDGKQARRTNSASPLGELFDHGCDSLSQMFITLEVCLSIQLGEFPAVALGLCLASVALFYSAHWQTYCCGKLVFSKFDVTEAQFCVMALCLSSALFGPQIWSTHIVFWPMKKWLVLFSFLGAFKHSCDYFQMIFKGGVGKNGSTVADTSVLFPLLPLASVVIPPLMIYFKSETGAFQDYFVFFCITFGLVSSKITNNIVIAHMSKSELHLWDNVLLGPLLLILNQYFNTLVPEPPLLFLCFVLILLIVLGHLYVVVTQLCRHLKIECFKIKPLNERNR